MAHEGIFGQAWVLLGASGYFCGHGGNFLARVVTFWFVQVLFGLCRYFWARVGTLGRALVFFNTHGFFGCTQLLLDTLGWL